MNVDIAERLAKRRREAGYSQETLAEKLGVSRQAVSKWERSESSPDTDNLIALAQLYGVSLDELLYVDESFKEDVEFEAADRAAERKAEASQASAAVGASYAATGSLKPPYDPAAGGSYADAGRQSSGAQANRTDDTARSSAVPGAGTDGANEKKKKVNIGFDGIHVNDGEDYVHVSWRDGVHVKDSGDGDEVHVGWDGVHVKEGKEKGDWFGAGDDEGNTVHWDGGSVVINGKEYDSWFDAHDQFNKKHGIGKAWVRFPFPLLAIILYILLGVFVDAWGIGLFVFFLIPLYYMVGHVVHTKKFAAFFAGLYPIAVTAWFFYMAFVLNDPHPAWVMILTIPLVEWFIHSIARASRRRKKEAEVIEVEATVEGK